MEFPDKFWDEKEWKIIKREEDYWWKLPSGEEKRIGIETVYVKRNKPQEIIREINLFKKGAVERVWFPDLGLSPKLSYSRISKDGKWIDGLPGERVVLDPLYTKDRKFYGVKVSLKVAKDKTESVEVYKNGIKK